MGADKQRAPDHTVHVTGWDDGWARLELRCTATLLEPCRRILIGDGPEYKLIDHCNAVDWFDNVGAELLIGELAGPPPWAVEIEWLGDYGPHITAAKGGD